VLGHVSGCGEGEAASIVEELHISKPEWVGSLSHANAFTWAEEEKESYSDHVCNGGMAEVLAGLGNKCDVLGLTLGWVLHGVVVGQLCHRWLVGGGGKN